MSMRIRATVASVFAVAGIGGAVAPPASAQQGLCPQLQLSSSWYGNNAAGIQLVIDRVGTCRGNPAVTSPTRCSIETTP